MATCTRNIYIIQFLILSFSLLQLASTATHNDPCGPSIHCNATLGLICESGRCACPVNGVFNADYSYNLQWNSERGLCVGKLDSVCVGTRRTPVQEGMKKVECSEELSCIQIAGTPPGIGLCKAVPKTFNHGTPCDKDTYCDSSRSLICTNGTCTCSSSRPNTSPNYNLIWDEEVNNCVGAIGSYCIGTKEVPVAAGQKMIECVPEAQCMQEAKQTLGVGICQRIGGGGSSTGIRLYNQMITTGAFVLSFFMISKCT